MIERSELEHSPRVERVPNVISFGSVEDFLAELEQRPPNGGVVRVDRQVGARPGKDGFGIMTASVLLSARRDGEVLVANFVTGIVGVYNGQPRCSADRLKAMADDTSLALMVLRDDVSAAGYEVARGVAALPENIVLYQAISEKLQYEQGRLKVRGDAERCAQGVAPLDIKTKTGHASGVGAPDGARKEDKA